MRLFNFLLCLMIKKIKKITFFFPMRSIVVWNGLAPSQKLATEAMKKAPTGQHVLHTPKGTYILTKAGEWKCVRGANNIADLIRAAHKRLAAKTAITATIIGATKTTPAPVTKKPTKSIVKKKKKPLKSNKKVAVTKKAAKRKSTTT